MTTRIGIAPSRTFPGNWTDAIAFCEQHGFDAVELKYELPFTFPDRLNEHVIAEVGKRVRAADLFLSIHGPYSNIGELMDIRYEAAVAEHLEAIAVARTLGARTYTLHGGWIESVYSTDELFALCRERVAGALERILAAAGTVKICLENQNIAEMKRHKTNCLVSELHGFSDLFPQLAYTFDTGHANVTDLTPSQFLLQLGPERIGVGHAHDNDGKMDQHTGLADGTTDWDDFARTYVSSGSQFPLMLELGEPEAILSSQKILRAALASVKRT